MGRCVWGGVYEEVCRGRCVEGRCVEGGVYGKVCMGRCV